uniref:Uncharacterized protein n=1 Tax=Ditylenchus dipsaci TaxID=166011 RepID=A0A915EG47_9BILA
MPGPIEGHTVTQASPQFAYVIGGYNGIGLSNTIHQFDMQTRSFTELKEKLLIARENHATVVYVQDGVKYLVVMGGWDGLKALDSCEVFRIMDEEPYLDRVHDHRLVLNSPRNKLAAIVVPDMWNN